jgi:hypothetical protein
VGEKYCEAVAVRESVGTLWYEIVKVIAGVVGVGASDVKQDVDGSEVAEGVTVDEIAVVGSCVVVIVGNCLKVCCAVTTMDAVGVKECTGDTVCDLMLLQYIDGVGVCVGHLDGVDVSVVVGENVGLSDGESVASLCEEAAAVNA